MKDQIDNNYFDPYEFLGLNDLSKRELEEIANQSTIKVNLEDLQRILDEDD